MAGFCAARALSTGYNDTPQMASRPWDKDRDGFVMGDGAGALVLEELKHAKARGANIMAEVVGFGLSGDAHHITAPAEDGSGAQRCMEAALKRAGANPEDIDYINAHGTSTPLGDEIELAAVERVFGDHSNGLSMSSTKSAIGHLLGAAGAVESIFSILAMRDGVVPPTLNLDNPSVDSDIDLVPHIKNTNPVIDTSLNFMLNKVGDDKDIAQVIMAGGPNKIFDKSIKTQFPRHEIVTLKEGIFANVTGFLLWGMLVTYGQKRQESAKAGKSAA